MDPTLAGIVSAALVFEFTFSNWHEPQIDSLEHKRREELRKRAGDFLRCNGSGEGLSESLAEFICRLSEDKDLILPVRPKRNPHKRIFLFLGISLIISILYGLVGDMGDALKGFAFWTKAQPYIKLGLALLSFGPLLLACYWGWDEYKYTLRMKTRFPPSQVQQPVTTSASTK